MEKNFENVKQIIQNVLSVELSGLTDDVEKILTPDAVTKIAEIYLMSGKVSVPYGIFRRLVTDANPDKRMESPALRELKRALNQEFNKYSPNEKKAFEDAAEVIMVKVAGIEFETYLDQWGTQRFKTDTVITHLFNKNLVDLDGLVESFYRGEITTEDLLNFYAKSGYSVCGLSTLSHFSHLTFENPLWDKQD